MYLHQILIMLFATTLVLEIKDKITEREEHRNMKKSQILKMIFIKIQVGIKSNKSLNLKKSDMHKQLRI